MQAHDIRRRSPTIKPWWQLTSQLNMKFPFLLEARLLWQAVTMSTRIMSIISMIQVIGFMNRKFVFVRHSRNIQHLEQSLLAIIPLRKSNWLHSRLCMSKELGPGTVTAASRRAARTSPVEYTSPKTKVPARWHIQKTPKVHLFQEYFGEAAPWA
jgi:hypothetical protein